MAGYNNSGRDHIIIDVDKHCKKCIFRVPEVLRKQKSDAYTPYVVSIGPFHSQRKGGKGRKEGGMEGIQNKFQLMERTKEAYLYELLYTMHSISLEKLTANVTELTEQKYGGTMGFEERARSFYAEPFDHISSQDFIQMMIVDGCFLIQLFRKCSDSKLRYFDDPIFNMDCMFHYLCHDLLLLENQLPWFVIHTLYSLTLEYIYPVDEPSLSILIREAFSIVPSMKQVCSSYNKNKFHSDADVLHILDMVRASIVNPLKTIDETGNYKVGEDAVNATIFNPDEHAMHSATCLSKVGIKFRVADKRESILDIRFQEKGFFSRKGFVTLPQLKIDLLTECLFRNLIAIEQCYHGYSNNITSYAMFMDNLISSKEDLELLCKETVIGNWLSAEEGCKFFRSLYKDIPQKKIYYASLCKKLNDRYKTLKQHQLGEHTRQQLIWFSNPWNAFSVIVGVVLLQIVPTLLQTAFTIKQYYTPSP